MINKKNVALVSIVPITLALAMAGIGVARRSSQKPGASHAQTRQNNSVEDTRSLKEKAKQAGDFIGSQNPKRTAVYAGLAELTAQSSAVIIGTPQGNTPTLSRDGKSLTLNYKVQVEYVYKGKLQQGNTVTVTLPGGRLKFDDGSTAEVRTPWFKKMQNGKTYALFLTSGSGNDLFVTTGEAQGIFEIPTTQDDRIVKSHSGIPQDPVWKYHGTPVKAFLEELRKATKKPLKS